MISVSYTHLDVYKRQVLPIGGLKEKTMAAFRNGIKTIILPADNGKDLEEIDQTVRKALQLSLIHI